MITIINWGRVWMVCMVWINRVFQVSHNKSYRGTSYPVEYPDSPRPLKLYHPHTLNPKSNTSIYSQIHTHSHPFPSSSEPLNPMLIYYYSTYPQVYPQITHIIHTLEIPHLSLFQIAIFTRILCIYNHLHTL